ncbi:aldehyde dehydrogenase (NAD(P)(+)) ald5 [Lobulomyces angularis]|nr:aldehyde dehydrogenase (NAD(P)(+)) ald5 [Lobulomyces angularis]
MTVSSKTHVSFKQYGKEYKVPTGLFINNQFVPSLSGKKFETTNPCNGEKLVEVYEADKNDVNLAVEAAKNAFVKWKKVTSYERSRLLNKLADLVERDSFLLAELESLDNGKTVMDSLTIDIPAVIKCLRYYAGFADKVFGKVVDMQGDFLTYTKHEPIGVCGLIIPWNFPLLMLTWKLGPAIACGNVCVLKTSEKTPLSALKFAELIVEADFPAGVFNILSGFGPVAGEAISGHMDIRKVAFTGSAAVGRKIMTSAAASNLKKVSLELGGKSPNIVFKDANLDDAVAAASIGIFLNSGQCCCAGSRVFVQEEIYDEFCKKFAQHTKEKKTLGEIHDKKATNGPLIDEIQFQKVQQYLDIGKKEGATVLIGGSKSDLHNDGYFVQPTLFADVTDNMTIAKEEIFGPVACIFKFKTVEEVIERANNTNFGLAAAVHTRDINLAFTMANELQAGTVWVNCYNVLSHQLPFGGYKESGIGRDLGP